MWAKFRFPMIRTILLILLVLSGSFFAAGKMQTVMAANCPGTQPPAAYFICPFVDGAGNYNWDQLGFSTSPDNGTADEEVTAGQVITAHMTYNPANDANGTIYSWIVLDANDNQMDQDASGNPKWENHYSGADGSPTNGSPGRCPSTWYYGDFRNGAPVNGSSHYYNHDAEEVLGHTPGSFYDYALYGGTTDGFGYQTCGIEGNAVYWSNSGVTHGTDYRYTVKFKVNPKTLNNNRFCLRGYVGVPAPSDVGPYSNVYARSSARKCYHISLSTISGFVQSDPTLATGKALSGVRIGYSRTCDPNDKDYVYTNSLGQYSFQTSKNQSTCIFPSNPLYNANASGSNVVDGTAYGAPDQTQWTVVCNSASCPDKDFKYKPILVAPPVSKKSYGFGTYLDSGGVEHQCDPLAAPPGNCDPDTLRPGDRVKFEVEVSNDIDANQKVDIYDNIPLNLDPNSVSVLAVYLDPTESPPMPADWYVDPPDPLAQIQPYGYGNAGISPPTDFIGNYAAQYNGGSGSTPPQLHFSFDKMPAYSAATVIYEANVKPVDQIGVYPGYPNNYSYCPGVNAGTYNNQNRVMTECEDAATGVQGVSNAVATYSDGVFAPALSPFTYNPIPGDVKVTKTSSARYDDNNTQVISTTTGFDSATYNIAVEPLGGQGPVQYTVTDQPGGISTYLDYVSGSGSGSGTFNFAAAPGSGVLTWDDISSGAGAKQFTWVYQAKPSVAALAASGGSITNTGQACFYPKWNPGWQGGAQICRQGSTVLKAVKVDDPFLTTDNGSVHGGGGIGDNCVLNGNSEVGKPRLNGNSGSSNAKYFVSVAGDASNVSNIGFTSIASTKNTSYNRVCRPDVVKSVQDFIAANSLGAFIGLPTGTPINGTYASGSVVSPNFGLPIAGCTDLNTQNLSGRWTLFVNGDLCIHGPGNGGKLKYNSAASLLSGTSSFGVVVTGNIYIDQDVTELDGFYFAGKNDAGGTSGGIVNTCARNGTTTLQSNNTVAGYHIKDGQCVQPLVVNGIMMGRSFRFNRVTPPNNGTVYSEIIDFRGQLYTVTPPGLSNLNATDIQPKYLGERRSRY
jgi:hypothetical protein